MEAGLKTMVILPLEQWLPWLVQRQELRVQVAGTCEIRTCRSLGWWCSSELVPVGLIFCK